MKLNKEEKANIQLPNKDYFNRRYHLDGTALYIDDDYVNYLYFRELFSDSLYNILGATTLNQAFQTMLLQKDIGLVVISDLFMNEENTALLRLFRKSFPDVPLILMVYDNKPLDSFSELGFDLYINRQTDREHLIESISELS